MMEYEHKAIQRRELRRERSERRETENRKEEKSFSRVVVQNGMKLKLSRRDGPSGVSQLEEVKK